MSSVLENEDKIKELFKKAIIETLEEKKELFGDLFREITEDIALANAIKVGEDSAKVSRSDVFEVLESTN